MLELKLGQYSAMGPVTVYSQLSPLFKGLGFVNFISQCFIGLYYNMIIAWTIYYFFASLTSDLPWQHCTNSYNDKSRFLTISHMILITWHLQIASHFLATRSVTNSD